MLPFITPAPHQPVCRPDPKRTVCVLSQTQTIGAAKRRRVALVVLGELQPVEANQAGARADPEITVTRLQQGVNSILRQAFLHRRRFDVIGAAESTVCVNGLSNDAREAEKSQSRKSPGGGSHRLRS